MLLWLRGLSGILAEEGATTPEASEIAPWLFIGGKYAADEAAKGEKTHFGGHEVTHMLNCIEPWCTTGPAMDSIIYRGFEAPDRDDYPLLANHYERDVKPALIAVRDSGGVCIVHCAMGVNRSACVVAAFLMESCGKCLLEVVELLKERRGYVLEDEGLQRQLILFAQQHDRLDSLSALGKWIVRAPPPREPTPVTTVPPPPDEWREASTVTEIGSRCRVYLYGEFRVVSCHTPLLARSTGPTRHTGYPTHPCILIPQANGTLRS